MSFNFNFSFQFPHPSHQPVVPQPALPTAASLQLLQFDFYEPSFVQRAPPDRDNPPPPPVPEHLKDYCCVYGYELDDALFAAHNEPSNEMNRQKYRIKTIRNLCMAMGIYHLMHFRINPYRFMQGGGLTDLVYFAKFTRGKHLQEGTELVCVSPKKLEQFSRELGTEIQAGWIVTDSLNTI